jgi:hypothetical protein
MESQQAFGIFNWAKRTIEIDSELEPHAAHLTLFHEAMHVILMDAGIQMDEVTEERLCDTYAAHRVAEMLK